MPVTITGDMTQEEVDQAMIDDLRALVASNAATNTINISHRQAERLLELLDASESKGPGHGPKAGPKAQAAAVDDDDDEEDERPKPRRR
jgi:regulator of RNase E activity RraB